MEIQKAIQNIENGGFSGIFSRLYGEGNEPKQRYISAVKRFAELYPERNDVRIFSASGRTEIGGNHTDHQHGCVLAAAVNLDIIAVAAFHEDGVIRVKSEGYDAFSVDLKSVFDKSGKTGTAAIVSGIAARFIERGSQIGGFDLYCTSEVAVGSGLSSSAAFETLIGTIIDINYNGSRAGAVEIAKIGQFAENVYFGKNSGLMDQMVSSVGGLVFIDFADTENPVVESFSCDFERLGYCICITDTKSSHADLTDDYSAIRSEMESVAAQFGKVYLRDVNENDFYAAIPQLRKKCSDRAVLRAAHFFDENHRASEEATVLKNGDIKRFLEFVDESGNSSAVLLQNLFSCSNPTKQALTLGIMLSKKILGDKGAVRVHGGGFAGTIQTFVPIDFAEKYISEMNRIFGECSCVKIKIRPVGGVEITEGL